jgi:hypothetical protein
VLLVLLFDLENKGAVLCEQDGVLVVETGLEVVTMEDAPEFPQKLETVFNVDDDIEVLVDVSCELVLDMGYLDVELDKVSVQGIVGVIKKFVVLLLELADASVEVVDDWVNVFKVVLLKGVELSDGSKEFDQLSNTTTEEFELAEDLVW